MARTRSGAGSKGQPERGVAKEQAADGGKEKKKKVIASRCSVGVLRSVMEGLEGKMSPRQSEAIKATPFYHLGRVAMGNMSLNQLEAVVDCYNPIKQSFEMGEGVSIPFTEWEFSVVLGLRSRGHFVDPRLKPQSAMVDKYFGGHVARAVRGRIVELLGELAGTKRVGDFARLYVLLVFNTVLFPDANGQTPAFLINYVDNLGFIGEFAWGKAVYAFLVSSMRRHLTEKTQHVDGCTLGLLGWVYERVPQLGKPRWLPRVPRFSRWADVHGDLQACKARMREVTADDVKELVPLTGEEKYVRAVRTAPKTTPSVSIKDFSLDAEGDDGRGAEPSEFEDDPTSSEEEAEVEKEEVCPSEPDGMSGRTGQKASVEEDDSEGVTPDDSSEEVLKDEETGEESVDVTSPERRTSARRVSIEQRTKGREDPTVVSSIARTVRARKRTAKAKEPGFITPVSSPKRVRKRKSPTRGGAKAVGKEAKQGDAVDAPRDVAAEQVPSEAGQEDVVDVDADAAPSPPPLPSKYIGRRDYVGQDILGDEDRITLDMLVDQCKEKTPLVRDGILGLDADGLFELIFNEAIANDLISLYLDILVSKDFTEKHSLDGKVLYVTAYTTCTMQAIVEKRNMSNEQLEKRYEDLWGPSKDELTKLLSRVNDEVRYIVLPVNNARKFHWFLITYDLGNRNVIVSNSMSYAAHRTVAVRVIRFMSWLLWSKKIVGFVKDPVERRNCRKQNIRSVDCGVHVLWWAEAYVRGSTEFWDRENYEDMETYRMQVALRIMRDNRWMPPVGSPVVSPPRPQSTLSDILALPPPLEEPAGVPGEAGGSEFNQRTQTEVLPRLAVTEVPIGAEPLQVLPPGVGPENEGM